MWLMQPKGENTLCSDKEAREMPWFTAEPEPRLRELFTKPLQPVLDQSNVFTL